MDDLPTELTLHIMQYCPTGVAARLLLCSQTLYACTDLFWKDVCMRDFGRNLDHLTALPALYRAIHSCAKLLHESETTDFGRDQLKIWRKQFTQALVPLQQLLTDFGCDQSQINLSTNFATTVDLAASIGRVAGSQIVIERLIKHVAHQYTPTLHNIRTSYGIVAAINAAVKINSAQTNAYATRKLANVVASMVLDDVRQHGNHTYFMDVLPMFKQCNMRINSHNMRVVSLACSPILVGLFCKLHGVSV